ncbi:MAG TPA: phosphatase PAP2 family protein [Bacteroidales bacterium]|nr:phosphatase PAP2 family protein [Bacteroidales bacterium]
MVKNVKVSLLLLFFMSSGIYAQNIDISILRSLNTPRVLPADNFYRFVTNSHSYIIIGSNLSMGAAGFIRHDNEMKHNALDMAISSIVTAGITQALKYSIERDRPFVKYPDISLKTKAGDPSFPSGHTSAVFSAATSVSLSYPEWYIIVPSYTWAGLVGYSRMRLGAHYPSDVLAGALIGTGTAWLTHHVTKKLNTRQVKSHTPDGYH